MVWENFILNKTFALEFSHVPFPFQTEIAMYLKSPLIRARHDQRALLLYIKIIYSIRLGQIKIC